MTGPQTLALALTIVFAVATTRASAQDNVTAPDGPGAGMPGPGGDSSGVPGQTNILLVLIAPAVQDELKLNEAQKTRVFEMARDSGRNAREMMQTMMRSGQTNPQLLIAASVRMRQEAEAASAKLLETGQRERVEQIMLRVEGPLAVVRPEVARKIGLSPAQTQQVQGVFMRMIQAQRAAFQAGFEGGMPAPPDSPRALAPKLREAATQQIGRILNAKQKAAFNKMLGEPFDVSKIDPALARPSFPDEIPADVEMPRPKRKGTTKKGVAKGKEAKADDGDKPKP